MLVTGCLALGGSSTALMALSKGGVMAELDEWGRVPLHYAALEGPIVEVTKLLRINDVNARDFENWTPLHFAARSGRADVVALLLDNGAEIDAVTDKGYPPLYWAIVASSGDAVATIRVLRSRGADPARATMKSYFGLKSPLEHVREIGNKPHIVAEFEDLL